MTCYNVAEILRELRSSVGKTQDQVAEACSISKVALARYETGARTPRIDIASRLADYYGVSVDYLLGNDNDPKSVQSVPDPAPVSEGEQIRQQILRELEGLPDSAFEQAMSYIQFLKSTTKDGEKK